MTNAPLTTYEPLERSSEDELTLLHLWAIVKQRRRLIYRATILAFLTAALTGVLSTKKYESKGEIQLQKDSSDALGLDAMMGGAAAGASDALDANVTLQTEAKIMESQTLALTVIDRLHLAAEPDFKPIFSPIGWALGFITPAGPSDPAGKPMGESPKKRDQLLGVFKKATKVAPVAGTRLIDISYTSTSPRLAAAVVNQMIDGLIDYNFQTRYTATSQTSDWLGKQLSELRTSSDALQTKVAELQRDSGVFSFGGEDLAGKGTVYSTVLDQLQQTTVSLTQAQSNRIVRGAIEQAARSGNPEALATLASSGLAAAASPAIGNSLALLQSLRTEEATQKAQISETSAKFGPAYTPLDEMQAKLGSVQRSIQEEQMRLIAQASSDYSVAQQVEDHTRGIFSQQKKSAEAMNDKAIQYQMLRQEADQSRQLYSRLQSRLKEAGVLEGLRTSNITVVEPGRIPSRPSSPNVMLLLLGVLLGGPFTGLACVFGTEIMDSRLYGAATIASRYGSAYLGDLPFHTEKTNKTIRVQSDSFVSRIFTLAQPHCEYSEALRSIRSALLLGGDNNAQVLLFTSSSAQEGKSTVAANLAVQLAQQGKRVLLVDADLRRATLRLVDEGPSAGGLSTLLATQPCTANIFMHSIAKVAGLSFIPAGPLPSHPSELLGSDQMKRLIEVWRRAFDFIVLDAAPVLPVTDSVMLAPLVDEVMLIARYGLTQAADLERSYRLLRARAPGAAVGIVFNGVKHAPTNQYSKHSLQIDAVNTQKGFSFHG